MTGGEIDTEAGPAIRAFDVIVCAHGFERRCTHLAENLAPRVNWFKSTAKIALSFKSRTSGNYARNGKILSDHGFTLHPWTENSDGLGYEGLIDLFQPNSPTTLPARVLVDVSSMSRTMMADWSPLVRPLKGANRMTSRQFMVLPSPLNWSFQYCPSLATKCMRARSPG
jgi:hypothetical protein